MKLNKYLCLKQIFFWQQNPLTYWHSTSAQRMKIWILRCTNRIQYLWYDEIYCKQILHQCYLYIFVICIFVICIFNFVTNVLFINFFCQGLTQVDLSDLIEDIKVYMELEQGRNTEYWQVCVQFTFKAIGYHMVYLVLRSRKCSDIVVELTYDRTNFRPIYRLDLFIPFFKF
jgi:hypothetical protein